MSDILLAGFGTIAVNLLLTLLNVKLFTEFVKQRMQEQRKPITAQEGASEVP